MMLVREEADTRIVLGSHTQIVGRRNVTMRDFVNVQRCCAWSKSVPQFFTKWALQAQYAMHAHAFLLRFFVTVENKRFVNRLLSERSRVGIAPGAALKISSNLISLVTL